MLESGLSGSVRGVPSNGHPYRDPGPAPDIACASQQAGVVKSILVSNATHVGDRLFDTQKSRATSGEQPISR